ncbi:LamG-like jellyroll fold domain-containing protein [Nonomuraea typhae]|uniref:LamG-like jellyroll fold domain-containing protein n=1 Tax=Nonomuraea typhae TaxID=2603600 RepID=UPI0012FB2AC6
MFKVSALARAWHTEVREGFLPRGDPHLDRQLVGDAGDRNVLLPATRGRRFDGLFDDVRIYNRALTATEIQNDMDALSVELSTTRPPAARPPPPGSALFHFPFLHPFGGEVGGPVQPDSEPRAW